MSRRTGGAHAIRFGLLFALCAPVTARAEEAASPPALHAGATSVEFAVNTFGGGFDAGTIGIRRHFSPTWAARLSLDASLNSTDETSVSTDYDGGGGVISTETEDSSGSSFDLSVPSFGLGLVAYF